MFIMKFPINALIITTTLLIGSFIFFMFLGTGVFGGTQLGITITTNPDLERGFVGHWTFDGPDLTDNVTDRSGQGNTGYLVGFTSTTTVPGALGQALEFDGVDDYTNHGNVGSGIQTIAFWVNVSTSTASQQIINIDANDRIETDSGGDIQATSFPAATIYVDAVSGATEITASTWHYVVVTDSTGVSGDVFDIASTSQGTFGGTIDDVRIYNRVLSAPEIQRLYELGATTEIAKTITTNPDLERGFVGHWTFDGPDLTDNVTDRSGQGNTGYLVGFTSTTTVPGALGQALEFDGVDDYTNHGNVGSGIQTIAFWVNVSTSTASQQIINIDANDRIETDSGGDIQATSFPAATIYVDAVSGATEITASTWHYVVVTDSTGVSGDVFDIASTSQGTFGGTIDDVRIYNRVLSAPEIQRLYELGATTEIAKTITTNPDLERGFVGHWTFDGPD